MITDMNNTFVNFDNLSNNATSYVWNFGDNSTASTVVDTTHNFPNTGPNQYTVTLTATDNAGCSSTKVLTISITALEMEYEIPNIFTPNGDDKNEYFQLIRSQNVVDLEVIVLNRWGNQVFTSNEVNFKWNGHTNNSGASCAEGTYFYKMDLKNMQGDVKTEHGFVQLSTGN